MMLMNVCGMRGFSVSATDGNVGHISDFCFDEPGWAIRYFVVDSGGGLEADQVMLSPRIVENIDWINRTLEVGISMDDLREELAGEMDHPTFHAMESGAFMDDQAPGCWDPLCIPSYFGILQADRSVTVSECVPEGFHRMMSVLGYGVDSRDGPIGYIEDFVADEEWSIRYLAIDMHSFSPVRTVLISPEWIEDIDWYEQVMKIDHLQEEIRRSPEYNPSEPINRDLEVTLYDYYGRPHYWL